MNKAENPKREASYLKITIRLSLALVALYTTVLGAIGLWDNGRRLEHLRMQVLETARAYYNLVQVTRLWNAKHGGVYVEVDQDTRPNPYLVTPDREIVTLAGRQYTKINPAYMTRMLADLADQGGGATFRLSSLAPINPANQPDSWEAASLRAFVAGKTEMYTEATLDGVRYFRYMAPLLAKPECLVCHPDDAQVAGRVRGGLTVNIPLAPQEVLRDRLQNQSIMGLSMIWLVTVTLMVLVILGFSRRLARMIRRDIEVEKLATAMQLAAAAAHELRQPLSVIMGYSEILDELVAEGVDAEQTSRATEAIASQCRRMNEIIKKMLNITTIKTKSYANNIDIIDLQESSRSD